MVSRHKRRQSHANDIKKSSRVGWTIQKGQGMKKLLKYLIVLIVVIIGGISIFNIINCVGQKQIPKMVDVFEETSAT